MSSDRYVVENAKRLPLNFKNNCNLEIPVRHRFFQSREKSGCGLQRQQVIRHKINIVKELAVLRMK